MRLFTAIELPIDVRNHIHGTARGALTRALHSDDAPPNVRPESLHVTLTFLGEVADQDVPSVCNALRAIQPVGNILLWTDHLGYFPPRGPVRVVFAGLGGDVDRLCQLYSSVENVCEHLGHRKEARPYTPHVTVLRARKPIRESLRSRISREAAPFFPGPRFLATEFALMQSDLRPSGPVYTPIAHFPLSAPP
jgi:2'-5' RNA ligase